MFSELSTFGKILIVIGYLAAVLLFVGSVVVTLFVLGIFSDGRGPGGQSLKTTDYIQCVLGLLWFWSSFAAVIRLIRSLHVFGSVKWCRALAGYLCLLIPFGTVFGILVFVYLGTRKDYSHAA
jgi:hypothetical protein